jgi:hypothetical protein
VESPQSLLIEIPEKRAAEILPNFNNDYELIASSLNIVSKRLVLLNPKYISAKRATTGYTSYMGGNKSAQGHYDMDL